MALLILVVNVQHVERFVLNVNKKIILLEYVKKKKPPINEINPNLCDGDFETLETLWVDEVYSSKKF